MRRQMTPIACNTGSTAWPIGYCHGFPSPKSPRMLTRLRNGKCPPLIRDSMLMQLPVPLDCIKRTPRAPPRSAPAKRHTLFLCGQRDRLRAGIGERAVDQDAVAGIRHIGELRDVVAAQQVVELVLPARRAAVVIGHLRLRA